MQTVRQRIPNCWARNGEITSAESAAAMHIQRTDYQSFYRRVGRNTHTFPFDKSVSVPDALVTLYRHTDSALVILMIRLHGLYAL